MKRIGNGANARRNNWNRTEAIRWMTLSIYSKLSEANKQ